MIPMIGDNVATFLLACWVAWKVGPWWMLLVILAVGWGINLWVKNANGRIMKQLSPEERSQLSALVDTLTKKAG